MINIIIHIIDVAAKPKIVLIGISRPLILIFQLILNGRGSSGFLALRLRIEAWANIKANREPKAYNVPMFLKTSLKTSVAKNPGDRMRRAIMLNKIIET